MSSSDEEFYEVQRQIVDGAQVASSAARRPRGKFPKGWEPHVELGESAGNAVSGPVEESVDERLLLEGWKLDPDEWEIQPGSLLVNRWQQKPSDDDWLYQYKARLQRRSMVDRVDVEEMVKELRKLKAPAYLPEGPHAAVYNAADWQIGKGEGGGTKVTVARIRASWMKFEHRMKVYKAAGYEVGELYVVGMGDLVEKCSNNYPDQEFTTDMTEREQKRVARHLLKWIVKRASKLAARVVVCTVGGNHGENRNAGKAFTDTSDNDDVALFESVAEALAENTEAFGHVTFNIPHDELMVVMEIAGTNICFTHGHLAKGGATPEKKQTNWWKNQQFGNLTAGDADVLVTAHYHHFQAVELADGKMWLQCPSQDGGSKWFQDQTGANSRPGSLCFVVGPDGPTLLDVV